MKDKNVSIQCYHHSGLDLDQYVSVHNSDEYVGGRCQEKAIEDGYIYCENHFPLHHSEQYNCRLDSGSGLSYYEIG